MSRKTGVLISLIVVIGACTPSIDEAAPAVASTAEAEPEARETSPSLLSCWATKVAPGKRSLEFVDVTESVGLLEPLTGMHGHAAIWTDINGDNATDLYVGTFADRPEEDYRHRGAEGPSPDRMLRSDGDRFATADIPEVFSRTAGGVSADLDNDGDLDLVISRNTEEPGQLPTQILENVDGLLDVVAGSGIPDGLGGRSVGVLDFDMDGLFDLFITEDRWAGGDSVLLRNQGDLRFMDATATAGIPAGVHGLGVAIADFGGDTLSDIFVAGSNRLFLSISPGLFAEADSSVFAWNEYGDEDDVAGASVADVNRDGLLDLALGHHFNSTLEDGQTVSVRLYLNQGGGRFKDVTEQAGLTPLPTKAPHVELNDFDNDGWLDLLTSASAGNGPAVFINEGLDGDIPRFSTPQGMGGTQYWVSAPSADYDRDGRLDVFLLEWEPSLPSLLLRNTTQTGNWLEVSVSPEEGFGLGWKVEVLDGDATLGAREITVTQGYSAGVMPDAHFGLGDVVAVDVRLTPPGQEDPILLEGVTANQHLRWPVGC